MENAFIDDRRPDAVSARWQNEVFPHHQSGPLEEAMRQALAHGLPFAGSVLPRDAWELFRAGEAVLIDVRTAEERKFVGHVPSTTHIPWMTGLSLSRNPRFVRELESRFSKDDTLLFLCRSGVRSFAAAEAASRAGFLRSYNVLEGFEGDLDAQKRRGSLGGWRLAGLPWIQD